MPPTAKVATAYIDLQMQTAAFKAAIGEATAETRKFSRQMKAEMAEAKGSIALLGEEMGVNMPRHLRTFVAQLPGVASAMSAAFDAVAVIALADFVYKAGEKVAEFFRKAEEAAHKNAAAAGVFTESLVKSNAQLAIGNDKLEIQIAKLNHKPTNNLKLALDEAKLSAIDLIDKLEKATTKERELLDSENAGWFARLTGTASNDSVKAGLNKYQSDYQAKDQQFDNKLQNAKSLGEEQEIEIQRRQALLKLSQDYYNALGDEIKQRRAYQALLASGTLKTDNPAFANTSEAALLRNYAARFGSPDQSKVIPALQNLQGQIGAGATGLSLELHHDELVNQDAALQAKKDATQASSAEDKKRLQQFEDTLRDEKQLHNMDALQEAAYWQGKIAAFREHTAEYRTVQERYSAASAAGLMEVSAPLNAAFRKSLEKRPEPELKQESPDAYLNAIAVGKEQQAALQASFVETTAKIDLATGAISSHAAALIALNTHTDEYKAKLAALKTDLAGLQAETIPGASDPQNAAKQQRVQNQIDELTGKARMQGLVDAQAVLSTTWTGMVDGVFDELIRKSQETQSQLKLIATSTIDSLNTEMARSLTGQKTDYSKVFQSASQSLAKASLEKMEGAGLRALGLGKRDGSSAASALFVRTVGAASGGGELVPGWSNIFGSSKPKVVGPGGASPFTGAASTGLLGMLNNSDWASGLMGGKLFGSGSIFGHFASGGDTQAGLPIDVGEMGRERFTPMVPGHITSNRDLGGGAPLIGYLDARGTDPALTQANVGRAMAAVHARAVSDAGRAMVERQRRTAH
jgi:hypothetical protein